MDSKSPVSELRPNGYYFYWFNNNSSSPAFSTYEEAMADAAANRFKNPGMRLKSMVYVEPYDPNSDEAQTGKLPMHIIATWSDDA